jgi:hypothetical protein
VLKPQGLYLKKVEYEEFVWFKKRIIVYFSCLLFQIKKY